MKNNDFNVLWLVFLSLKAKNGFKFKDLIDNVDSINDNYKGAWANILVKANTIHEALEICPTGLSELGFEIEFIDKIENFNSKYENKELNPEIINEAKWLLNSKFVFMISDKIFPYY